MGIYTAVFSSTIFAMVFSAPLLHISVAETCKALCLHSIETSGNHVVAYLYYNGTALRNRIVEVVLNQKYIANVSTNHTSALNMYAPFSIGKNIISMKYEGSTIQHIFYYFGNYLSLALLPTGAAVYVSIRLLSNHSASNKEVTIVFEKEHEEKGTVSNKEVVMDTIAQLHRQNARMCMIKALPVSVDEVFDALHGFGDQRHVSSKEYLNTVCVDAYYGVLCNGEIPYREVVAKKLYEKAMKTGKYILKKGMSVSAFLRSNSVIHFSEICSMERTSKSPDCLNISVLTYDEEKAARLLLARCSRACTFLLFNELNGFVSVTRC